MYVMYIDDDKLMCYERDISINGATVAANNRVVITKEAFIECYQKWVLGYLSDIEDQELSDILSNNL